MAALMMLLSLAASFGMLYVSGWNYPGGYALQEFASCVQQTPLTRAARFI